MLTTSAIGVRIGGVVGSRYKKRTELVGGAIPGSDRPRVLLEHLGSP